MKTFLNHVLSVMGFVNKREKPLKCNIFDKNFAKACFKNNILVQFMKIKSHLNVQVEKGDIRY